MHGLANSTVWFAFSGSVTVYQCSWVRRVPDNKRKIYPWWSHPRQPVLSARISHDGWTADLWMVISAAYGPWRQHCLCSLVKIKKQTALLHVSLRQDIGAWVMVKGMPSKYRPVNLLAASPTDLCVCHTCPPLWFGTLSSSSVLTRDMLAWINLTNVTQEENP